MITVLSDLIIADPAILAGKPIIRGTRIPVDLILEKLAMGETIEDLNRDYPRLTKEHVQAVLAYTRSVVANEEVYPLVK